jgi:ubiquinone/menaquinone biosynthesis C-methylase UbiE
MSTDPDALRPALTVVVPVWGEERELPRLLPALRSTLEALELDSEIVVSAGRPSLALTHLVEDEKATLVHADGTGYGEVLGAGLHAAHGEWVLTMDADFAHIADFVPVVWGDRERAEIVIGSRYVRGSVAQMPLGRSVLSRLLNALYRTVLSLPFRDLSSGFRLYRRRVLQDIEPLSARGLDILPEILVKAICQGWSVAEVPFWYRGGRPWTRARMLRFGWGYLGTLGSLFSLRNSVKAADYDHRAFDSWIPLQRYWQRRRFEIIRNLASPVAGTRVLDIGCGSSRIVQTIPGVIGMDLALRKLRWLRAPGRHLLQGDLSRLPFRDGTFDTVICSEVIEHIPKELVRLEELTRVLQPGGLLVLGTPDYSRRRWLVLEWLYGKVFPNGYVKEHINRYTRAGLRHELRAMGLQIVSERYVGGSEMIFAARVPTDPSRRIARR